MTLPAPNPNARLTRYRYDDTDRLIAASSALNIPDAPILASYAYGYDKASNLVSMNGNGIVRDLDVTATNALNAGTYDAGGNPLRLGAATYGWDAANRLVSHTVNNTDSSFVYDGQSRLVRIIDRQEGVVVADRSYLWCGLERCLERDNMKAGAPVSKRYFAQGVVQDGVPFRYISDSLGSVRQLVDAGGRTRARYDFEPYGGRNKVGGDLDTDFAFAGLFGHGSSGLNLAVYRGYDPQRGRWLNRDPIEELGGLNLFSYVDGNPWTKKDPLGLWAITFEGYAPLGGGIIFGRDPDTGGLFATGRFGLGVGGGASFDINGGRPGGDSAKTCHAGVGLGLFAWAGGNIGPFQGAINGNLGTNNNYATRSIQVIDPSSGDGISIAPSNQNYGGIAPSWSVGNSWGFHGGGSAGAEATLYRAGQ
ncbi:RHS repeat domain-containing protein [Variovorax sp. SRS16]|uniref:RHS repeat domain-containing protein n=1 Tax=Variovorax sp. SRS16 TaxID=282217 RepID=UPI0013A54D4F|nr:RHS repeat-associated core domain-containing protein [Variovorax sp. SRS16]